MENEIVEVLNRNTALLKQLINKIDELTKKKTSKLAYDGIEAMKELEICERSLNRLHHRYPEYCKKLGGKWYHNLPALLEFKEKGLL